MIDAILINRLQVIRPMEIVVVGVGDLDDDHFALCPHILTTKIIGVQIDAGNI